MEANEKSERVEGEVTETRRPYERPRIESGDAFERVQLASGCNEGIFDGCDVPC
jgi:hypothetical protein